jgi:hypothetical protein
MIFARILKVDERRRTVIGRAVQEVPDKSGEIFDYASSRPYFEAWSADVSAATGGASLGNVREMHSTVAAGKVTDITFDDHERAIDVAIKVVDDGSWQKVLEGVFTGLSIGGRYLRRWTDVVDDQMVQRYTAAPTEISLVDAPCVPTARFFEVLKRDGSVRRVAFQHSEDITMFTPRDENYCGRSTAANLIKAALSGAPSGDLTEALGKRAPVHRREERLMQGVSKALTRELAKAGMRIKGPTTSGRNGATESSIDAIRTIHSQGARKMAPTSLPPQSSNAASAPRATRADVQPQGQYATPSYSAPPLFGAAPHDASEHDDQRTPPGDSDQYGFGNSLDAIKRVHAGGAKRMWET